MNYIPYSCQSITDADIEAVVAALRSEYLTQGPTIAEFEKRFAAAHDVRYAVAVSNATAALHISCLAFDVGPGSRVWTSPNSFVASANCALYCGATIDFVDIDARTRNMSIDELDAKLRVADRDGRLPNVVIPVDFSGSPCDLREIRHLADKYGFKVLEDASHATGATYQNRPIGGQYSHASVFSFHAIKIVTTAEGGIVTTDDEALATKLRLLRSHGVTRDPSMMLRSSPGAWYYEQHELGFNYRMTDLQAALGLTQLERLPEMSRTRARLAARYDDLLSSLPLVLPARPPDRCSAWHLYVVEVDQSRTRRSRGEIFQNLRDAGIGVNVHYIPIHTQPYYRRLGFNVGDFPTSEHYFERAISIPLFPTMTQEQQERVVAVLAEALGT